MRISAKNVYAYAEQLGLEVSAAYSPTIFTFYAAGGRSLGSAVTASAAMEWLRAYAAGRGEMRRETEAGERRVYVLLESGILTQVLSDAVELLEVTVLDYDDQSDIDVWVSTQNAARWSEMAEEDRQTVRDDEARGRAMLDAARAKSEAKE